MWRPRPGRSGAARAEGRSSEAHGASVTRNAVFGGATQITTAVFTAAVTLYLVRELGSSGYGVFAIALGIGSLIALIADFGLTASAARFVAERKGKDGEVRSVVVGAAALMFAFGVTVAGALALLAPSIAKAFATPELVWPLRAMALAVLAQTMFLLFTEVFVALGRVSVTWRLNSAREPFEAAAIVGLVALGAGAAGAAFGRAIGYAVGACAGALAAFGITARGERAPRRKRLMRPLVTYAGALFVLDLAYVSFEQLDVLLIGVLLSAQDVGEFEAPMRLAVFLGFAGQAVAFAVAPRLAHRAESGPDVGLLLPSIRYLLLLHGLLVAPLIVWAGPIVDLLLGPGYEDSASVLRGLAPFVYLVGVGTLVTLAVNYLGRARSRIPLAVTAVVVNLCIDLVLLPEIGVMGAVIGTDVAFSIYVVGHLWICRGMTGLAMAPVATSAGTSVVAGAAMAGVLASFGTSELSFFDWVAGGLLGASAYIAVVLLLGELRSGDLSPAARRLARRVPAEPNV